MLTIKLYKVGATYRREWNSRPHSGELFPIEFVNANVGNEEYTLCTLVVAVDFMHPTREAHLCKKYLASYWYEK